MGGIFEREVAPDRGSLYLGSLSDYMFVPARCQAAFGLFSLSLTGMRNGGVCLLDRKMLAVRIIEPEFLEREIFGT